MANAVSTHPSTATARCRPRAGRCQQRTPATRRTAPAAASKRPFSPMTPRSGWRPANKESQGRNAPVAINAPPTTAADATRRSWVDGDRATLRIPGAGPNVEEEVDVGRDVPGDLRAGRIACLQGAHRGEALSRDNLVPRGGVFHPDDVELPPVPCDLVDDVTVSRERRVLRPGAEDPRHVDRGRMVDAMADHRALQRRVGGTNSRWVSSRTAWECSRAAEPRFRQSRPRSPWQSRPDACLRPACGRSMAGGK